MRIETARMLASLCAVVLATVMTVAWAAPTGARRTPAPTWHRPRTPTCGPVPQHVSTVRRPVRDGPPGLWWPARGRQPETATTPCCPRRHPVDDGCGHLRPWRGVSPCSRWSASKARPPTANWPSRCTGGKTRRETWASAVTSAGRGGSRVRFLLLSSTECSVPTLRPGICLPPRRRPPAHQEEDAADGRARDDPAAPRRRGGAARAGRRAARRRRRLGGQPRGRPGRHGLAARRGDPAAVRRAGPADPDALGRLRLRGHRRTGRRRPGTRAAVPPLPGHPGRRGPALRRAAHRSSAADRRGTVRPVRGRGPGPRAGPLWAPGLRGLLRRRRVHRLPDLRAAADGRQLLPAARGRGGAAGVFYGTAGAAAPAHP
ncbi:hypothetical protein B0E53_05035 [Micromonospora sp. MH33]|nr:hypothetical protein B0E53_05035 [Micromonospora sp. MH33]